MKRRITMYVMLFGFFFVNSLNAQTTSILDNDFETFLETHDANGNVVLLGDPNSMGDGIDGNDLVLTSNISGVTSLDIQGYNIANFEGLQFFTSLTQFTLINNQANPISNIDFSGNIMLTNLSIINTPNLSQINILQNINLVELIIASRGNLFESIDVSANINLTSLQVPDNALSNLNITANTKLTFLSVAINPMTNIETSNLIELENLDTYESQIISLDLSQNTTLQVF